MRQSTPERFNRASYGRAIVVDTCAPVAPFATSEISVDREGLVRRYVEAGVTFVVFTVVDDFPNSVEQTIKLIGSNRRFFLSQSEKFVLVDTAQDVRRAKAGGRLAVGLSFQGTNALLGDIALVEVYRRLGILQMLLAYNVANLVADGCHENRNAGLSEFGRSLIAEMNRVGVIVDVTHVGVRSSLEALELTCKPPVFSHSTPRKFSSHPRNITDEQIRACASKDGLIGLTGVGLFMDSESKKATVSRLVDTIEYVAQLVGPQHAAVGLDYIDAEPMARYLKEHSALYGGGDHYPADGHLEFVQPCMLPEIAEDLARRKYADNEIRGILGENYLRVLHANVTGES